MNSGKITERSESDFVRLLREIRADRASSELLLEHPLFQSRLRLVTMAHASTTQDAEDLANDVRLKVWQNLRHFKPDYRYPYGNFFGWLRVMTRNKVLDNRRRHKVEFDEHPVEDLNIVDTRNDIEASVLYKEVMAEFEKSINALPDTERLAIAYYLQGFTYREISEKMLQAGFSISHAMVGKWVREGLNAYFQKSGNLKNIRSKNIRVTKVRAMRAKREFHTILDQAINSGTPAITPENIHRPPLTPFVRSRTSKTTQPNSRPGWKFANDLLRSMQSPKSKQGVQAAFEASPEALGRAAVEHATKGRRVPVSSLTTFLMAASTVNVVGRVINLSKDAA
jgi:antitoxin Phd